MLWLDSPLHCERRNRIHSQTLTHLPLSLNRCTVRCSQLVPGLKTCLNENCQTLPPTLCQVLSYSVARVKQRITFDMLVASFGEKGG